MPIYRISYQIRSAGAIGVFTWSLPVFVKADHETAARDVARAHFAARGLETAGVTVHIPEQATAERWVFTNEELKAPHLCNAADELIANVGMGDANGDAADWQQIIVTRAGTPTNRYADGTAGVPTEWAELAACEESLMQPRTGDTADNWRDVIANTAGQFLAFPLAFQCTPLAEQS